MKCLLLTALVLLLAAPGSRAAVDRTLRTSKRAALVHELNKLCYQQKACIVQDDCRHHGPNSSCLENSTIALLPRRFEDNTYKWTRVLSLHQYERQKVDNLVEGRFVSGAHDIEKEVTLLDEDTFSFQGHRYYLGSCLPVGNKTDVYYPSLSNCQHTYFNGKIRRCPAGHIYSKESVCKRVEKLPKNCQRAFAGCMPDYFGGFDFHKIPKSIQAKLPVVDYSSKVFENSGRFATDNLETFNLKTCRALFSQDLRLHRAHRAEKPLKSFISCRMLEAANYNGTHVMRTRTLCPPGTMVVGSSCRKYTKLPEDCYKKYRHCSITFDTIHK